MCLGGGGSAPEVVYSGPDPAQITEHQRRLDQYRSQLEQQQQTFATQLQTQIQEANKETKRLQAQFDAETASAQSAADAALSPYVTSAQQTDPGSGAQTTQANAKKKNTKKSSLKISSAAVPASAGSGLNIGV